MTAKTVKFPVNKVFVKAHRVEEYTDISFQKCYVATYKIYHEKDGWKFINAHYECRDENQNDITLEKFACEMKGLFRERMKQRSLKYLGKGKFGSMIFADPYNRCFKNTSLVDEQNNLYEYND